MKKSRKVLSVVLSALLIITSIPFVVVATAEGDYQVSASDSGSVELEGTALKWTQTLTYAGSNLYNLKLTATANSNTMFESTIRSKVENNYFVAKNAGYYLVELWGGAGAEGESTSGSGSQGGNGGDAGYVYGYIYLDEGDILYSSIGGQGKQVAKSDPGDSAANEGGVHGDTGSYKVGGGGGYSALYLFKADEKDSFESKYVNADGTMNPINEEDRTTRYIMIAGGGGGGGTSNSLIHNRRSLLPTRQTGTADGGNGGTMTSPSGKITTGVPGTFYAGSDGKSSGKNTDYVGMGGTNVPGEITETANNLMAEVLEFFGIDSSISAQPNDWTGLYNSAKEGGYGGDGNLRGGAGGAGFAGGSGGLMPNYGSVNAYYVGGGGGGSSFVADTVNTNLTSDMQARLVGSNYSDQGGQSAITYLGEAVVEEDGFDFSYLTDVSFAGSISKYFEIVSVSCTDENGAANGAASFDENGFTVSNANVLNEEATFSGNKLTVNIVLDSGENCAGGNGVPVLDDISYTDSLTGTSVLAAADSVKYANVPLSEDVFAIQGKSFVISEPTLFNAADLFNDDFDGLREILSEIYTFDFIESVSEISVYDGASLVSGSINVAATKDFGLKMTVTPKEGTPAVVGPVQAAKTYEGVAHVTKVDPGTFALGDASGVVAKTLEYKEGNYVYSLEFKDMVAMADYVATDFSGKQTNKSVETSTTYTAPFTGWYALQAWGACGGIGGKGANGTRDGGTGGTGGYVSAYIHLNAGDVLTLTNGANGTQGAQAARVTDTGDAGSVGGYSAIQKGDAYLIIAGGGGGGGGYALAGYSNGGSVDNSALPNTILGDLSQYNGQENSNYHRAGTGGKNFRSTDCSATLPETVSVQTDFTPAQSDYSVPNDNNSAHGGAAFVTPVSADIKENEKVSNFYNLSVSGTISKYFDFNNSNVAVSYNGQPAKSFSLNVADGENGAQTVTVSNIKFDAQDRVLSDKTVPANGDIVVSVAVAPKVGFLGGNDILALTDMKIFRDAGTAQELSTAVAAQDVTDYVNVEISDDLTDSIVTEDKTVICGESVNYTDLYEVNYALPSGSDSWKADFVDLAVSPASGSFAPTENTPVSVTLTVSPKTATAQKAKTVASVSGIDYTAISNVTVEYTVTDNSDVVTLDGDSTVVCGNDYAALLKADSGYILPETITVKSGAATLTAGGDYTYDNATGALVINAAAITGNISIEIEPIAKTYSIKLIDASVETEVLTPIIEDELMTGASLADIASQAESYAAGKAVKAGYHFEWDEIPAEMPGNDLMIFGDYAPNIHTVTIHYVDGGGATLAPDYSEELWYGSEYRVISPEMGDLVPSEVLVQGLVGDEDIEVTVTYAYAPYTLSIFYLYSPDNTDDTASTRAAADYSAVYGDGASFSVDSPVINGYTASVDIAEGTMDADGEVFYVYYTQNEYTVTYNAGEGATVTPATQKVLYNDVYGYDAAAKAYGTLPTALKTGYRFDGWYKDLYDENTLVNSDTVYNVLGDTELYAKYTIEQHTINILYVYTEDGSEAAPSVETTLDYGTPYSFTTPHITGYSVDKEVVEGTVGNANELIYVHYDLIVHTKEELKAALDAAKALNEDDYTGSTWDVLEEAVENGDEVYLDDEATVKEISIATETILEAMEDLIDRTGLKDAIDEAEGMQTEDDYDNLTEAEKKALQDAIDEAKEVYNDPDATKEEIEEAIEKLKQVITDTRAAELEDKIEEGENLADDIKDDDDIPQEDKDALDEAIEKAKEVLEKDPPATQEEIEEALEELQEIIDKIKEEKLENDKEFGEDLKEEHPAYDNVDPDKKEALDEALEKAEEVLNKDPKATDEELQEAIDELNDAIEEVLKDEIDNLLDDADEIKKGDDYEDVDPEKKQALDDAIAAAEEILNQTDPEPTKEELKEARDNLQDAINEVLKDELQNIIDDANALDEEDYTGDTWDALQEEIKKAEDVINDPDATEEEIKQAIEDLKKAIEDLIDRSELKDAIDDGNAIKDTDVYDELDDEHKQALEDALEKAQEVYDDPSATEQEIADAKAAIDEAIKDILKDAIDKAEELDEYDYSEGSWNDLQDKVDTGKDVYADGEATPEEIREAAKDILNAIDDLVDLTELEKELSIAESLDPNKFTDDVAEELAEKIAEAEAVYNDPDATQEEVDAAAEMLAEAVEDLISKGNYRKYNAEKKTADELDNDLNIYDSEAFEAYKKAVEEIDKGLSRDLVRREQSIIDDATQALKDARAELEANGRNSVLTFVDESGDELKVIGVTPGTKFSEAGAPELPLGNNIYYYAGWLDGEGNLIAADTQITSDMTITRAREFKILVVKGDSGLSLREDVASGVSYVMGLEAGTTVAEALAKLENDETVLEVRSFEHNELSGLDVVGTGSYAILKSKYTGEIYGKWAFIIMGDCDGDGDVDTVDYEISRSVAFGESSYTTEHHYFFIANNVFADDNIIDACDMFEVRRLGALYALNHAE